MMRGADDHDLGAGATDLSACEHQLDVLGGGVRSAELEAVACAHAEAGLITLQAFVDAGLHLWGGAVHGLLLGPVAVAELPAPRKDAGDERGFLPVTICNNALAWPCFVAWA